MGESGAGRFCQSGGTNSLLGYLHLGRTESGTGTYILTGGSLSPQVEFVGYAGRGSFNQSGGTNTMAELNLASLSGASGTYELSGGSLRCGSAVYVGRLGMGTFTQSDGTNAMGGLRLGESPMSTGLYQLSGGSLGSWAQEVGFSGIGSFNQWGGTNAVGRTLTLGVATGGSGSYRISGGLLDIPATGWIQIGPGGPANTFEAAGGTVRAGKMMAIYGTVKIGKDASVTLGGLELANTLAATVTSFELTNTRSAFISGAGSTSSAATIGPAGDHTLDLQTGLWRPREGDVFFLLTGFQSITGAFTNITTDITLGQQSDPNGLPIPFFATDIVTDPNDPSKVAFQVAFQGLTAGDANGDHKVNGGDLSLMAGSWKQTGQTWGTCDFNGNGKVEGGDLALMGGNWSWALLAPAQPQSAPLPEPTTLALLGLGAAAWMHRKR